MALPPQGTRQCLATFVVVTTQGMEYVKDRDAALYPAMSRTAPTGNDLPPNVHSVKVEKCELQKAPKEIGGPAGKARLLVVARRGLWSGQKASLSTGVRRVGGS